MDQVRPKNDQTPRTKDQLPRTRDQVPRTRDQVPRTRDQVPRAGPLQTTMISTNGYGLSGATTAQKLRQSWSTCGQI